MRYPLSRRAGGGTVQSKCEYDEQSKVYKVYKCTSTRGYEEVTENKYENSRRRTACVLRGGGVARDYEIMRDREDMSCEYKP